MIHSYQDKSQSYQDKTLVHYNTSFCTISVTCQRSAVGKISLCLEEQPGEVSHLKADHCHAARLLNRENLKKAHLGCHIYGINCLTCSQIICDGKDMHKCHSLTWKLATKH